MKKYVIALDQGTTSSRAVIFNHQGQIIAVSQKEFEQIFPKPGWVEHNPAEIIETQIWALKDVVQKANIDPNEISGIGITNQRETTVLWDRDSGEAIHNAIVWQDRRTSGYCDQLRSKGYSEKIKKKTGLVLDAYFSGTKIKWILDETKDARQRGLNGELAFGTVDSWLLWNLTKGKVHATDVTNASRTMVFNISELKWDQEILDLMDIPKEILPEVRSSSEIYGYLDNDLLGVEIPICGIAGDQHAALFGQLCIQPGMAKSTYGTGCFLVLNTGENIVMSNNNLLTTIAWQINGKTTYALEGSVFIGGAVIQWLRDGLQIIDTASESEALAASVEDSGGVVFVPALTGLGAPHWDPYARGMIIGLTRGSKRGHIVRAALESISFQVADVINAMELDTNKELMELRVDGGAVANSLLLQIQADILQKKVIRPNVLETTALGAAYLAGLAVGFWDSLEELNSQWQIEHTFTPEVDAEENQMLLKQWNRAVDRAKAWSED